MTPKTLEDDLVEVVATLVIEVALHQRRMRRAIRLGTLGLLLIAAAFAGAVYLAVDTRTVVSRSPCANLRAPSCFRRLVTHASPRTLAILKRRLAAQERRARQREQRRLNRRRDSGPIIRPSLVPRASLGAPASTTTTAPPPARTPQRQRKRKRATATTPAGPLPASSPAATSTTTPPPPRPIVDVVAPTVTTPAGTVTTPSVCARPVGGIGC
jgi:hypothetical protein